MKTDDIPVGYSSLDGQEENISSSMKCIRFVEKGWRKITPAQEKGVLLSLTLQNVHLPDKEVASVLNGELLHSLQDEERNERFIWCG